MKKFLLVISLLLPMMVMAQEEKKDTTIVIPQSENSLLLTAELSKYGYTNKDALSLIMAARLSKLYGFVEETREKEGGEASAPSAENEQEAGQISLDPQRLLADARVMAQDDGILLALIEDVDNNVRGPFGPNGPCYAYGRVQGNSYDYYNMSFQANELAVVMVVGSGNTDLDLYIYDQNGNFIASDTGSTDECICTWTPRWTGTFKVKIINRGGAANRYIIRSNQ
ncbi:MAG: hypothetical protein IJ159_06630 [Prevotella sp.]|nr:hypothetical protein [Prevotella sp.]